MTILKRSGILLCSGLGLFMALLIGISDAGAQNAPLKVDSGDTAWVLVSSAFVLAMLMPGLALFYGGLVRTKNVLATIMQSVMILSVVSVLWVLFGYSLAFGPDKGGVIGGLDWVGLSGVGAEPHPLYGPTIPHQAFVLFQMMFAAIAPALITGAFAERKRFTSVVLFAAIWSIVVYVPLVHWIWGGGWLAKLGALDFAGGAVIHISSGASALVCAIILGKRRGYGTDYMAPHNLPMTLLGTGFLWLGGRFQRRQRAGRERHCRVGHPRYPYVSGHGRHGLVWSRVGTSRQAYRTGGGQWRRRWTRDGDARGRLYQSAFRSSDRCRGRYGLLRGDCLEGAIRL